MDFQTVGFADYQNVRNFFRKDGIMVHLFVTKEMVDNDWNLFHDYIFHEVAIPVIEQRIMKRGTFSIIFSDGEENKKWLKGTSLENLPLPSAMLIDFVSSFIFYEVQKNEYRYQPKNALSMETLSSDLIQFINDFSLGMAVPLVQNAQDGLK